MRTKSWQGEAPQRPCLLRILLSIFIVLQLAVVLLTPNNDSFLGRKYFNWYRGYANQFGFQNKWGFFSPDPAPAMILKSRIDFVDKNGVQVRDPIMLLLPPSGRNADLSMQGRRKLSMTRFFLLQPNLVRSVFLPWLCRENPGASGVLASLTIFPLPKLHLSGLEDTDVFAIFKDHGTQQQCAAFGGVWTESNMPGVAGSCLLPQEIIREESSCPEESQTAFQKGFEGS